jgi:hypothetical protein
METRSKDNHDYEIKICCHLSGRRARMFEGLKVTQTPDGHTSISGKGIDQAALFGILIRIRDSGIPLLSVNRTDLQDDERNLKSIKE